MRRSLGYIVMVMLAFGIGCGSKAGTSGSDSLQGGQGQPCMANNACNDGLTCIDGTCSDAFDAEPDAPYQWTGTDEEVVEDVPPADNMGGTDQEVVEDVPPADNMGGTDEEVVEDVPPADNTGGTDEEVVEDVPPADNMGGTDQEVVEDVPPADNMDGTDQEVAEDVPPADNGVGCGNGVCEAGETNANCAADCPNTICTPECSGKCGGPDQCDGTCPDTCSGPNTCDSTNWTCQKTGCASDGECPVKSCQTATCTGVGTCQYVNAMATCDDSNGCTVNDSCDNGVCAGSPKDCADGITCTTDACTDGTCTHTPDAAACPGATCVAMKCDLSVGCAPDPAATPTCDDANPCTVGDKCVAGVCQSGVPSGCDDGNSCTNDSCDAVAGCTHSPNKLSCSDGDSCTSGDVCSAGQCVSTPVVCTGGTVCNGGSCIQPTCVTSNDCVGIPATACPGVQHLCVAGLCESVNPAVGAACDVSAGDMCTGGGICGGAGDCLPLPADCTVCAGTPTCDAAVGVIGPKGGALEHNGVTVQFPPGAVTVETAVALEVADGPVIQVTPEPDLRTPVRVVVNPMTWPSVVEAHVRRETPGARYRIATAQTEVDGVAYYPQALGPQSFVARIAKAAPPAPGAKSPPKANGPAGASDWNNWVEGECYPSVVEEANVGNRQCSALPKLRGAEDTTLHDVQAEGIVTAGDPPTDYADDRYSNETFLVSKEASGALAKLNGLLASSATANGLDGYKLYLNGAWDSTGKVHSGNSYHYYGAAVDIVLCKPKTPGGTCTSADKVNGATAAGAAILGKLPPLLVSSGFSWVWYEDSQHVHASITSPSTGVTAPTAHRNCDAVRHLNFPTTSSSFAASVLPNRRLSFIVPPPPAASSRKTTRFWPLQTDLATRGRHSPVHTSGRVRR